MADKAGSWTKNTIHDGVHPVQSARPAEDRELSKTQGTRYVSYAGGGRRDYKEQWLMEGYLENAKDTLCRNVLIYGHCRYEDQGCAFNHDPNKTLSPPSDT